MRPIFVTQKSLEAFRCYLVESEKSRATVEKYLHEVRALGHFLAGKALSKAAILAYREQLQSIFKSSTINAKLSAINSYLEFMQLPLCKVRLLKIQRSAFIEEKRELTAAQYHRLLSAARSSGKERLYHLMLTIGSTGIRVGELCYITVEAAQSGSVELYLKGKCRTILLPQELCKKLLAYARKRGLEGGPIFCTKSGKPLDRSNICHEMKKLCALARVTPSKVYPHNLRHLFARSFYAIERNLCHLADILGHSSIETTRIYVAASTRQHERTLRKMKLVI